MVPAIVEPSDDSDEVIAKGKRDSRCKEGPWESVVFRAGGWRLPGGEQLTRRHWLRSAKEVLQFQRREGSGTCLCMALKMITRIN